LIEAYDNKQQEIIALKMRVVSLKSIKSSDSLIINQFENVSIPLLEDKIRAITKKDSIININTKLEISSLHTDIKIQSRKKWTYALGGFAAGILSSIIALLVF